MLSNLLQLDATSWCLPSASGEVEYAFQEQLVLLLFFVGVGVLFYKKMMADADFHKVSEKRINLPKIGEFQTQLLVKIIILGCSINIIIISKKD